MNDSERWAWVGALYEQHRETVAGFLMRLTQTPAAVDDLVSETFIRAFEAAHRFEARSQEKTWLLGIALNIARNHQAREQRQRFLRSLFFLHDQHAPGAEDAVAARSGLNAIERALRTLPAPLREAYVLRVFEDRSLKETAMLLNVPISTVSERAARAEALVHAALSREG